MCNCGSCLTCVQTRRSTQACPSQISCAQRGLVRTYSRPATAATKCADTEVSRVAQSVRRDFADLVAIVEQQMCGLSDSECLARSHLAKAKEAAARGLKLSQDLIDCDEPLGRPNGLRIFAIDRRSSRGPQGFRRWTWYAFGRELVADSRKQERAVKRHRFFMAAIASAMLLAGPAMRRNRRTPGTGWSR